MNVHAMIRSLDVIQSELDRLRADSESGTARRIRRIGPNGKPADVFDVLRGLCFLGSFYVASNRRLQPSAVSEAARQAGYDPRGTGGFYTGNGCLRSDEDYRVLTQVGIDWFDSACPRYKSNCSRSSRRAGYRSELARARPGSGRYFGRCRRPRVTRQQCRAVKPKKIGARSVCTSAEMTPVENPIPGREP